MLALSLLRHILRLPATTSSPATASTTPLLLCPPAAQTIDRLKINANHENKEVRIQRTLETMGQPKRVELKNGGKVDVHTPFTTRAKELMQLYNGLNLPMLNVDERLDVLLHVKWTVKEFDCNLTREVRGGPGPSVARHVLVLMTEHVPMLHAVDSMRARCTCGGNFITQKRPW